MPFCVVLYDAGIDDLIYLDSTFYLNIFGLDWDYLDSTFFFKFYWLEEESPRIVVESIRVFTASRHRRAMLKSATIFLLRDFTGLPPHERGNVRN